jgi:hypothetical protein
LHEGKHGEARFCVRRKTLIITCAQNIVLKKLIVRAIRTDSIYYCFFMI